MADSNDKKFEQEMENIIKTYERKIDDIVFDYKKRMAKIADDYLINKINNSLK